MGKGKRRKVQKETQESDEDYVAETEELGVHEMEIEDIVGDLRCTAHTIDYHYFTSEEIAELRQKLLAWYDQNRRELPWRRESDVDRTNPEDSVDRGYAVWVSEIMLQQTRVQTVIEYFRKWMTRWPTLEALANATLDEVNEAWAGLGYYRRARMLHEGAQTVVSKYGGKLPRTAKELEAIKGIGKYTAGAIASIAYGEPVPAVDGNVTRIIARLRAIGGDIKASATSKLIWKVTADVVDTRRPGSFNQALMDFGTAVCTPTNPKCSQCPLKTLCIAYRESQQTTQTHAVAMTTDATATPRAAVKRKIADSEGCPVCTEWDDLNTPTTDVTRYPVKTKKAQPRDEHVAVCIVERKPATAGDVSTFLIVQRPSTGLLASFWEFPSVVLASADAAAEERQHAIGREVQRLLGTADEPAARFVGAAIHLFTHLKHTYHVMALRVAESDAHGSGSSNMRWVTAEEFHKSAVSKGMKRCFAVWEKAQHTAEAPSRQRSRQQLISAFLAKPTTPLGT